MKPYRLTLTNALILGYGLHEQIDEVYDVRSATREEIESYHDSDYIEFLQRFVRRGLKVCIGFSSAHKDITQQPQRTSRRPFSVQLRRG